MVGRPTPALSYNLPVLTTGCTSNGSLTLLGDEDAICQGFSLIELSIVLVIIGLIVGGTLAGRILINAAEVRAQIAQVEKYNVAANSFYEKYGGLPGDLAAASAAKFGLVARSGAAGRGDGNGELDGWGATNAVFPYNQDGENLFFWEDLSAAHLIDQSFSIYVDGTQPSCSLATTCGLYYPVAKIGGGNFLYTYSGYATTSGCSVPGCGPNFFGISVSQFSVGSNFGAFGGSSVPGVTVAQAYAIDSKIDDGLPTSGHVRAQFLGGFVGYPIWSFSSSAPSSTTCYDTSTGIAAYSTTFNNGAGVNCGISFQMQAGD